MLLSCSVILTNCSPHMESAHYSTQPGPAKHRSTLREYHSSLPCPVSWNWYHLAIQCMCQKEGRYRTFYLTYVFIPPPMWSQHLPNFHIMTLNLRDWPGHTASMPLSINMDPNNRFPGLCSSHHMNSFSPVFSTFIKLRFSNWKLPVSSDMN